MKRNILLIAAISLSLTACGKENPDALSIRQAYIAEEAKKQAEDTQSAAAQARDDIGTAAKIGAENAKADVTNFLGWAFDELTGEWEFAKDVATTPNSEVGELIRHKDEYLPGDDEYRLPEPEETAAGYLEKSETAGNLRDAAETIDNIAGTASGKGQEIAEVAGGKATQAAETVTGMGSEAAGQARDAAGNISGAAKEAGEKAGAAAGQAKDAVTKAVTSAGAYSFTVPDFNGTPYIEINGNRPFFTEEELASMTGIHLSQFDVMGRCGSATEMVSKEMLPTEPRGEIGMVKPSGWNQAKYDSLKNKDNPAGYLYARCHLIAYCLSGLNAEPRNLITGTLTQFNVDGMEPFELQTLYYVKKTGNHVLYRVSPLFKGTNLVADGVLMEAQSVEDDGLSFCVFVYNTVPIGSGVTIDYSTGISIGK